MYNNSKNKYIFLDVTSFSLYVSDDIDYIILKQGNGGNKITLSVVWNVSFSMLDIPCFNKEYSTIDAAEQDYLKLISYFNNGSVDFKFDRNRLFVSPDKILGIKYFLNQYGTNNPVTPYLQIALSPNLYAEGNIEFPVSIDSKPYFLNLVEHVSRFKIQSDYTLIDLYAFSCYVPTNTLTSLMLYNNVNKNGSLLGPIVSIICGNKGCFRFDYPFTTFAEAQNLYESLVGIFNKNPIEFVEFACGESRIYGDKYSVVAASYETDSQNNQEIKISKIYPWIFDSMAPAFVLKRSNSEDIKPDYMSLVEQIRKYSMQSNQKITKQSKITDMPIYKSISLWKAEDKNGRLNDNALEKNWCLIDIP